MSADISVRLHDLADALQLVFGRDGIHVQRRDEITVALRSLADRNLVELPTIDPAHDDLGHWYALPLPRLRSENAADAWNLAAGLHEEATRAGRADDTLRLLGRTP